MVFFTVYSVGHRWVSHFPARHSCIRQDLQFFHLNITVTWLFCDWRWQKKPKIDSQWYTNLQPELTGLQPKTINRQIHNPMCQDNNPNSYIRNLKWQFPQYQVLDLKPSGCSATTCAKSLSGSRSERDLSDVLLHVSDLNILLKMFGQDM